MYIMAQMSLFLVLYQTLLSQVQEGASRARKRQVETIANRVKEARVEFEKAVQERKTYEDLIVSKHYIDLL